MSQPLPEIPALEADIHTFFEMMRCAKILARQISSDLPPEDPFQALHSEVIAYLPDNMDQVPVSILEIHTAILHEESQDGQSEGEGENEDKNSEDHEEVRSPHDAAGSSPLTKPTSPPKSSNSGEVLSTASPTYSDTRLVPPTPPANSEPHPNSNPALSRNPPLPTSSAPRSSIPTSNPNSSAPGNSAPSTSSHPANMAHLSSVAAGKRRVPFGRANAFLGADDPAGTVFFDFGESGSTQDFEKVDEGPALSRYEDVTRERGKVRRLLEKNKEAQARGAHPASQPNPSGRAAATVASPPRRTLDQSVSSHQLPDILASRTQYNASTSAMTTSPPQPQPSAPAEPAPNTQTDKKGKKRARDEDQEELQEHVQGPEVKPVPAGASTFDPGLASTSDDVADKRPTRKARTSEASGSPKASGSKVSSSKASSSKTSRKTSGVSKFFRGEDVPSSSRNPDTVASQPETKPKTRAQSKKRFVAEEAGPKATYEGRPVVMIMSKFRSKSVEIPDDELARLSPLTALPEEEEPALPPAKMTKATKATKANKAKGKATLKTTKSTSTTKGTGKKRARAQEPEDDATTESALVPPSPPKKPRRGRVPTVSQPKAGAGPSNGVASARSSNIPSAPANTESEVPVPAPQTTATAEPDAAQVAQRGVRRSTRQANLAAAIANGEKIHS